MSKTVWTVLGTLDTELLGIVMPHEHLALALSLERTVDDMQALEQELRDLSAWGCRTIVELSNIGMGRDITRLVRLSQTSGLNIIAGTGFYEQNWHPPYVRNLSIADLTQIMTEELQHGIANTGIRAGVIGEIGTSQESITPDEEKVLRAAARAHLKTGKPISTHTAFGHLPHEQVDLLLEEGVKPQHIAVGHLDMASSYETPLSVARRGVFIAFDTFGKAIYQSDEVRIKWLLSLIEAGFSSSLLLSVDISRNSYMKAHGGYGYDHLLRVIVPELRRCGLGDETIKTILIENPRRFLEGVHNAE